MTSGFVEMIYFKNRLAYFFADPKKKGDGEEDQCNTFLIYTIFTSLHYYYLNCEVIHIGGSASGTTSPYMLYT